MTTATQGTVFIDLARIRTNAITIGRTTGVDVIAVVKADAYGAGAVAVADAIKDVVAGFYVFSAHEAVIARLGLITGKSTIAAVPDSRLGIEQLVEHRIRQCVWSADMARLFAPTSPVLSVDTGMQRFACATSDLAQTLHAYEFQEAMTHGVRPEHASDLVRFIKDATARKLRLHAAGSALLGNKSTHLDATRPGLALYHDAVTVALPLIEARESRGVIGYTRFASTHHGVILAGYSHGLAAGPCIINGTPQRIVEVGMQSSFVTLGPSDRAGNVVTLLGVNAKSTSTPLSPVEVAAAWNCTPQQVLVRLTKLGERVYTEASH